MLGLRAPERIRVALVREQAGCRPLPDRDPAVDLREARARKPLPVLGARVSAKAAAARAGVLVARRARDGAPSSPILRPVWDSRQVMTLHWGWPGNAKKAHIFEEGGGVSLCRKWFFFGQDKEPAVIPPNPQRDDCVACHREALKRSEQAREVPQS